MYLTNFIVLLVGAAIGAVVEWVLTKNRLSQQLMENRIKIAGFQERFDSQAKELEDLKSTIKMRDSQVNELQNHVSDLKSKRTELETIIEKERQAAEEKLMVLNEAQVKLSAVFENIANQALKSNNQAFLQLAEESLKKFQAEAKGDLEQRKQAIESMVKPLQESLRNYDEEIQKVRITEGNVLEQIKVLKGETETLSRALRQPQVKGKWGEYTLKRVVELAGMSKYCDFTVQKSVESDSGKRLRPDLIIHLPGDKRIIVDAKTPLMGYMNAMEVTDNVKRNKYLHDHARQVRAQIRSLGSKSYWEQFDFTPDFVVMFLPGDHFLSSALDMYPDLFEEAVQNRVLLSTPANFIALLKTIAMTWRQEKMAESAMKIGQIGKGIYDHLVKLAGHFKKIGGYLDKSVHSYNDALRELEGKVLISARKFNDLGITTKEEIPQIEPVDRIPNEPKSTDWP